MYKKFFTIITIITLLISSTEISAFENSIDIKFKVIPPGKFIMGSSKKEPGHEKDEKLHEVYITKPFFMATTETTQAQWIKIMGYNPSSETNRCDKCPVESVSWNEVQVFIRKLNQKENTSTYRLPTEAEWEYACRAYSNTAFYTGDIEGTNCKFDRYLDKAGWYCGNSGQKSPFYNLKHRPVAMKLPNNFGLYDMHGNVMEWCLDSTTWKSFFSTRTGADLSIYKNGIKNPVGRKGNKKIVRGGSYAHSVEMARSANRFFFGPKVKRPYIGFRIVKEIKY